MVGTRALTASGPDPYQLGYLGMGSDAANGILRLHKDRLQRDRIRLFWDPTDSMPLYQEMTACLRELSQQLAGDYVKPEGFTVIEDFVVTVEALPTSEETHPWVEPDGPLPGETEPDQTVVEESPVEQPLSDEPAEQDAPDDAAPVTAPEARDEQPVFDDEPPAEEPAPEDTTEVPVIRGRDDA